MWYLSLIFQTDLKIILPQRKFTGITKMAYLICKKLWYTGKKYSGGFRYTLPTYN